MRLLPALFSHSGGAVYHLRALLHQGRLWDSHRESTRRFLKEWNPQATTLVLIGPSGGYSLPGDWLRGFSRILAVEPDPIARRVFELRTGLAPTWIREAFTFDALATGAFQIEPGAAVLFCNLLGQLDFDQDSGLQAQALLESLAKSHPLASYHDALSGDGFRFSWEAPRVAGQELRVKYEVEAFDPYLEPLPGVKNLELHLHPACYLFQDEAPFQYQYWEWRLTKKQTHIIEGVYSRP